jgi:hypothetical protein
MRKRKSDRELAEEIANSLTDTPSGGRGPTADAQILLQQAANAGDGPLRQEYLQLAQREIAKLDPGRHRTTIQRLQSQILALQGRRGDTRVAHVTPGEFVVPRAMQTPELWAILQAAALKAGIDPARLVVGSHRNSINPNTGQPEFYDYNGEDIEEITVPGDLITDDPSTNNVIAGLHPSIRHDAAKFINDVKDMTGQQLRIPYGTGMRTNAEQDALYAKGRTAPGKPVTQALGGQSYHNHGLAFDVVPLNPDGKTPNWNAPISPYAPIAQALGFEWGGNWKNEDKPHFQWTYGYTTDQLRQMTGPSAVYPTIPGKRNR